MFEVTSDGTEVWRYEPGFSITRALKYADNYSGIQILLNGVSSEKSNVVKEVDNKPVVKFENSLLSVSAPSALLVQLFSVNGKKVLSRIVKSGSYNCSLASLSQGTYIVRASSEGVIQHEVITVY